MLERLLLLRFGGFDFDGIPGVVEFILLDATAVVPASKLNILERLLRLRVISGAETVRVGLFTAPDFSPISLVELTLFLVKVLFLLDEFSFAFALSFIASLESAISFLLETTS